MMPTGLEKTPLQEDKPLTTIPDEMRPAFDYSGLDEQTVDTLHMAESQYTQGKKMAETGLRWMVNAVAMAHDALCVAVVQQLDNGRFAPKDDTFRAWCASIGVSKSSAYNLLKVAERFGNIELDGKSILDVQPTTLLYEAAKPSAPAELVQQVKDGDITTNKEYQAALAQIKAEKDRADAAEAREEEAWNMVSKAQSEAKTAQENLDHEISQNDALHEEKGRLLRECEAAKQARADAENRADAAEGSLTAALADVQGLSQQNARLNAEKEQAEARAHKAEDALKSQPITAVVDKEETRRQAEEMSRKAKEQAARQVQEAQRATAAVQAEFERFRQAADGFLAPEQVCVQQAQMIANAMRSMYLNWCGQAVAAGAPLAQMGAPLYALCGEIQTSLEEDTTINPTAAGSVEDAEREALFE